MKKVLFGFLVFVLSLVAYANPVGATVNDFSIKDFQADYYLNKDSNGHSTLKTVENITALFPEYDQNHGIERAIPLVYDGHFVNLHIESVKDPNGTAIPYTTSQNNGNLVLKIGSKNLYVHGANTYVITYNQNDVTKYYPDTGKDEFYWNTNGTGWQQNFDKVTARLHVDSSIVNSVNGSQFCYFGLSGSNKKCDIAKSDNVFTATVSNLSSNENMTIVVGFAQNTFKAHQMTFDDFMYKNFFAVCLAIVGLGLAIVVMIYIFKGRGAKGRGTIIAEYLPPQGVDIALSSVIVNKSFSWVAAMYVDLAVRHNIKIIDSGGGSYCLELVNANGLDKTELSVVKSLFSESLTAGSRYTINSGATDTVLADNISLIFSDVQSSAKYLGYYGSSIKLRIVMALILSFALAISFGIGMIYGYSNLPLSQVLLPVYIVYLFLSICLVAATKPLSAKGRELLDYLKGLKMYIKIAEEDRLKVLQTPRGSSRAVVDVNNSEQMVVLYERVLPYAILFGQEKEWTKVIGKYYQQSNQEPSWYVGNNMFDMMVFSAAMSNFSSSAVSNSYIAPSNSSSGGSSGGGFSGGGGGGGGGGGW